MDWAEEPGKQSERGIPESSRLNKEKEKDPQASANQETSAKSRNKDNFQPASSCELPSIGKKTDEKPIEGKEKVMNPQIEKLRSIKKYLESPYTFPMAGGKKKEKRKKTRQKSRKSKMSRKNSRAHSQDFPLVKKSKTMVQPAQNGGSAETSSFQRFQKNNVDKEKRQGKEV